ncbi:hypothetical protein M440DRAFT_1222756 [Trichoderma longibrachiatum ATCC 18648]|uniref:Uncharacterized protein n=1 Tax=Trichoderma longibrachiatum ATCC 18648 TaxID=983965 RepID=A0A2T4C843_TRILO|nr:hypothetical protein M440DRAFT_1222756 [Trichoderma longibrachiatum ATCC 18648]
MTHCDIQGRRVGDECGKLQITKNEGRPVGRDLDTFFSLVCISPFFSLPVCFFFFSL